MGSLGNDVIPVMANGDDRAAQKSYWHEHSAQATVEAMLLDTKAADIDKEERPEVDFPVIKRLYIGILSSPSQRPFF